VALELHWGYGGRNGDPGMLELVNQAFSEAGALRQTGLRLARTCVIFSLLRLPARQPESFVVQTMEGVTLGWPIPLAAIVAGEDDRPSPDCRSDSPHPHLHRLRSQSRLR
jgi:hypothetical protein